MTGKYIFIKIISAIIWLNIMSFITSIICFLIFQNLAFAEQVTMNSKFSTSSFIVSLYHSYRHLALCLYNCCYHYIRFRYYFIHKFSFFNVCILFPDLPLLIFDLFRIRYMKKNHSPPEYFDDEIVIEKKEFQNLDETPEIYQIQPIITVSEVVSSVKESLEHLGNTVMPKRWSPEVSN